MAKSKNPSPFAKNLTALLEERGITVRDAARNVGVSPSTIVDWKSGVSPTDYEAVRKLAKLLGVSMCYLLTSHEESATSTPPPISSVFEPGQILFDGIASIKIVALVPKKPNHNGDLP
ncbi:MAG TPA: helix-turn-helix transcriptional regulator [Bdellovibrionales bacterium]|nr:helix-turn-helix transcriptional regulator [Bdellovibrionales bacterium]